MLSTVFFLISLLLVFAPAQCLADIGPPETATVDGFKVEYVKSGQEGSPTVVYITGFGSEMQQAWEKIFEPIAQVSLSLAYDRLNYGNSDPSPDGIPQTGEEIVRILRGLLQELALPPPYVLVAHSIGGLYAQIYARKFSDEVAGVVMVDCSNPKQMERFKEAREKNFVALRWYYDVKQFFMSNLLKCVVRKMYTEIEFYQETAEQIENSPAFPDTPLTVITAAGPESFWTQCQRSISGNPLEVWKELQEELAALSPQGQHILANNSGHFVQLDEPDSVIDAVKDMLEKVRKSALNETSTY